VCVCVCVCMYVCIVYVTVKRFFISLLLCRRPLKNLVTVTYKIHTYIYIYIFMQMFLENIYIYGCVTESLFLKEETTFSKQSQGASQLNFKEDHIYS